ncbi:hypothetical protein [Thiomonas sp.]
MSVNCPVCGTIGKKLLAIQAEGTFQVNESGFGAGPVLGPGGIGIGMMGADLSGTVSSQLAEDLQPPEDPAEEVNWRPAVVGVSAAGFFGFVLSALTHPSLWAVLSLGIGTVIGGLFLWASVAGSREPLARQKADATNLYRKALRVYPRLRYCGHCSLVFDEQTGAHDDASPAGIERLIRKAG